MNKIKQLVLPQYQKLVKLIYVSEQSNLKNWKFFEDSKSVFSKKYISFASFKDDYNTFDWVISCLIKICGHGTEQASQCAHIIHFNGQCDVKRDSKETISKMKEKLQQAGLSVTIEKSK